MSGTILVPLDGSVLAEQGILNACRVARETQATLLLMTAVPFSIHTGAHEREQSRTALHDARQHLRYHQQVAECAGFTARTLVLPGDPVRAILFAAEDESITMVSMATHGYSGRRTVLLGSVAAAVARGTRIPILLSQIHEGQVSQSISPFAKVLLPLDGSPFAESSVNFIQALGLGRAGEVLLLRAVERNQFYPAGPLVTGEEIKSLFEASEQETARQWQEAETYLREVAAEHLDGWSCRLVVAKDAPASAIADTILRDHADVVVLTTHDRHGVDRLLHSSVARAVLHRTEVPVLLLPGSEEQAARTEKTGEDEASTIPARELVTLG